MRRIGKSIRPWPHGGALVDRVRARIDAADAAILECAARARVDIVVTGDGTLLKLGEYDGIPVVSPRDLWLRLQHGGR